MKVVKILVLMGACAMMLAGCGDKPAEEGLEVHIQEESPAVDNSMTPEEYEKTDTKSQGLSNMDGSKITLGEIVDEAGNVKDDMDADMDYLNDVYGDNN